MAAKEVLQERPVRFTGRQAAAIGKGFGKVAAAKGYRILACAILPEHVHLVIGVGVSRPACRGALEIDPAAVLGRLKHAATDELIAERLHPFQDERGMIRRSRWGKRSWSVYLDTEDDVRRAIEYVEGNPLREGLPRQRWSFVRGGQDEEDAPNKRTRPYRPGG